MAVIHIKSLSEPGVEMFSTLTEAQLCDKRLTESGLFIAESGKVIGSALDAGYEPVAMLTAEKSLDGIAAPVVERVGDIPVYVGSNELLSSLTGYGFQTAAMALTDDSIPLDSPVLKTVDRLALVLGTEGDGLSREAICACDYVVRIPMQHGVDSLNVAAASAVAFWELRR